MFNLLNIALSKRQRAPNTTIGIVASGMRLCKKGRVRAFNTLPPISVLSFKIPLYSKQMAFSWKTPNKGESSFVVVCAVKLVPVSINHTNSANCVKVTSGRTLPAALNNGSADKR